MAAVDCSVIRQNIPLQEIQPSIFKIKQQLPLRYAQMQYWRLEDKYNALCVIMGTQLGLPIAKAYYRMSNITKEELTGKTIHKLTSFV